MKLLVKIVAALCVLLLLVIGATALWMIAPYPQDQAPIEQALQSDRSVRVSRDDFLVFEPATGLGETAIIFYPGGKVDPVAYAPVLREIARRGLPVVVTPMPLKTAFLGAERANDAMDFFPGIQHWYLAGHSLGGVAASLYAEQFPDRLEGLLFWASYPITDLSHLDLDVLSIYATGDRQTTLEDIEQSRGLMPADAQLIEIEGDHWQFGHFSSELQEEAPTVSREQQQAAIVAATVDFVTGRGRD